MGISKDADLIEEMDRWKGLKSWVNLSGWRWSNPVEEGVKKNVQNIEHCPNLATPPMKILDATKC